MEMSPDLIKENHRYLKTCILYEVLQKIPIFDSYRNFCNTVGKDAMDYPDFEFWYYRFYHGNRYVDYDRNVDPEPKTLADIPVVLMNKIVEYLDPVERTYLRSMNHALKTVADYFPPVFEKIDITISDIIMHWTLNYKPFSCPKKDGGCTLYRPNFPVEESEMCHIQKSLKHLAPLLKMPNVQVNLLSLNLFEQIPDRDDLLPVPFNAKRVLFWSQDMNKVLQYLSAMNPGHLESISLDGLISDELENHRILFETDQFKQAKRAEFKYYWGFNVEDLRIMEMSSDLIKDNHRYLKTCILYEVLQKKPIFDSYRNFCNTVGKDAMDYPDFEFWYYRFYHGNRDVDYDRRAGPEPKTLEDIPVVLMKKIAEYLDPVERTYLRSMNRALKTVADFFPPVFEKIEISISDMTMDWTLNNKRPNCAVEKSEMCHIKKGLEYLAPVLKIPNIQVNLLSLHLFEQIADRDDLLPVPFNAKRVHFWSQNMNKVIEYLSALNPGHLESISLDSLVSEERENHRILFETDQFKQAKRAEFKYYWGFNVEDLVSFSHLDRFKCQIRIDNTFEDVPKIRVILSTFEELESYFIIPLPYLFLFHMFSHLF
ncbi:unnamed protein product [Caenorhabditis nigoni]